MVLTLVTWLVCAVSGLRRRRRAGRRAAYVALGGFVLVIVARLALAGSHFA